MDHALTGHRLRRCSPPASCLRRRQICPEQIWTAAGGPRSAQRAGVRSTDGPSTNLSGTNLDRRRRAPQRAARRSEAHGWAEHKFVRNKFGPPQAGRTVQSPERQSPGRGPNTISSGTKLGRRRRAPERKARRGEAQDGPNTNLSGTDLNRRRRAAQCKARSGKAQEEGRAQFRPERNWTAAGGPRSAKREGVRPMDGPSTILSGTSLGRQTPISIERKSCLAVLRQATIVRFGLVSAHPQPGQTGAFPAFRAESSDAAIDANLNSLNNSPFTWRGLLALQARLPR